MTGPFAVVRSGPAMAAETATPATTGASAAFAKLTISSVSALLVTTTAGLPDRGY